MKKFLYIIVFIIISVLGATFAIHNAQPVRVAWYGDVHIEQPLALVLVLTLAAGVVLGWLVAGLRGLRRRRRTRTAPTLETTLRPAKRATDDRNLPLRQGALLPAAPPSPEPEPAAAPTGKAR